MDKEYIDAVNKDKSLFKNRFLMLVIYLSSTLVCLFPLITIDNNTVINTEIYKNFADDSALLFPHVEYIASKAGDFNLYYFAKFQLSWAIYSSFVVFIISFFTLSKMYLFNLGYINANKERYENMFIKKRGCNTSDIFSYMLFLGAYIFIVDFLLFESIVNWTSITGGLSDYLETTKSGLFFNSVIITSSLSFFTSYLIIESIARIRKVFIKLTIKK